MALTFIVRIIIGESKAADSEIYVTGYGACKADDTVWLIRLTLYIEVNYLQAYFAL